MTSQIIYKGDLRTVATHMQSGSAIETDAPTDNKGKGERFSPTDLIATALGSCMITTIGIKSAGMNIDLANTRLEVTKIMVADPRRIGKIIVQTFFPEGLNLDQKQKDIIENTARTCPVARSMHPDTEMEMVFHW